MKRNENEIEGINLESSYKACSVRGPSCCSGEKQQLHNERNEQRLGANISSRSVIVENFKICGHAAC